MDIIELFILVVVVSVLLIGFARARLKAWAAVGAILVVSVITGYAAVNSLLGSSTNILLRGSIVTGSIPVVIDPLSAWFILTINFTFITGTLYGARYLRAYKDKASNLTLHWISLVFTHVGLLGVCSVQNSLVFIICCEVMAVSAFLMVIFEGHKTKTIKAGINYLIQSHITIVLLVIGFIWVAFRTGSYYLDAIGQFARTESPLASFTLMLIFFVAFGIKAGFVPFHTWLPHAHPAAPSHVSGIMSGVLIKIGIYGIMRVLFLLHTNFIVTGYFILVISVITGVYGVMLAIVQHNLKRLLAYHSIENIGIIGIGIGIGCIGMGRENTVLAALGFAGALLHTLNHSLFKSLLFYSAGVIYQATHTMSIERFGGLIKRMPHTSALFLVAALAICGLPPFNGFVSEFIIYTGLFREATITSFPWVVFIFVAVFSLALIGGLAILCFTKAFGSIFLGTPRHRFKHDPIEKGKLALLPMYAIVAMIMAIGLFPQGFTRALMMPVSQLTGVVATGLSSDAFNFGAINRVGISSFCFIALVAVVLFIRHRIVLSRRIAIGSTWGCGYVGACGKMQYTASSFVRNYRKLAEPLLFVSKEKSPVSGVFPGVAAHATHTGDRIEEYFIIRPLRYFRYFLSQFRFLQNGRLQFYILYGMVFVILLVGIPFVVYIFRLFVNLLNTL